MELSYILGNGSYITKTLKNFLYFKRELQSPKNKRNPLWKNLLYFGKWNFLTPSLKNFLYFRRENARPENQKFLIFLFKHKWKRKKFLILFLIKKQNFLN